MCLCQLRALKADNGKVVEERVVKKIRVLLVEDHHVVRAAVAAFLSREEDLEIVGEVARAVDLPSTVHRLRPDLLLLDAHMPGHKVVESARELREAYPDMHILVLSAYDRREYVVGLLQAGAAGYVLKDDSPDMLIRAVRAVCNGEEWVSPRVARVLVKSVRNWDQRPSDKLTDREMEVLRLMAEGYKNEEIAAELVITTQTVKNHVTSIFRRLGVESRVEAVLYAINHGMVNGEVEQG
jgi:DNA-binding NarL/FixJ family response regulator